MSSNSTIDTINSAFLALTKIVYRKEWAEWEKKPVMATSQRHKVYIINSWALSATKVSRVQRAGKVGCRPHASVDHLHSKHERTIKRNFEESDNRVKKNTIIQ